MSTRFISRLVGGWLWGVGLHLMGTRRSIVLTDPQAAFLQAEAMRLGITMADLIRRIIDQYRDAARLGMAKRREAAE